MEYNFLAILVAAIVPIAVGFIWYHDKLFGKAWAAGAGLTEDKLKSGNMGLIFGLSFVMSLIIAWACNVFAIHDPFVYGSTYYATGGTMQPEAGSELANWMTYYNDNLSASNHNFNHGFAHMLLIGLFLVLPMTVINGLFERRGWKYMLIEAGYWIISLGIMGGIIAVWR